MRIFVQDQGMQKKSRQKKPHQQVWRGFSYYKDVVYAAVTMV
jgi:hypothetical protein